MPITTSITVAALKKPIEDLYSGSKDLVRRKLRVLATEIRLKEIQKAIKHVQKVKTMWCIDKEVPLTSFYYPSKLIVAKARKAIGSIAGISLTENFVIQGTVGQGKSIFLRYLCLKELAASQRIPVFIELRRYDRKSSFREFLINAICVYRIPCDDAIFEYLAESGKLVLLLDAFDEIEQEAISHVLSEIEGLAQKHPNLQIVVTSRPDSGIERSPHFRVYQLAPLTAEDHKPFLKTIVHEKERVEDVVLAIGKSRSEIKSLLTTPLLLTLLVIIYNATQEIPSSLSEFYDALFYTLLTRHDKSKPGFRRKRETGLSDSELRKLFEAFCYAARQQNQLVLKDTGIASILERASDAIGIECNVEAFAHDMTKVACLMQQEGFEYHFIHKSVVEFHAASFVGRASEENARKFYTGISADKWPKWRQELEFLSQIDRHRYLKYFYVPAAHDALEQFHIDSEEDRISAESAAAILSRVFFVPTSTETRSEITPWSLAIHDNLGFVAYQIVMTSINKLLLLNKEVLQRAYVGNATKSIEVAEYLKNAGTFDIGLNAANEAVHRALESLRGAQKELQLESLVAEFVAP